MCHGAGLRAVLADVVLRVRLLQVPFELLLQRLGVFLLVWAMTSAACLELCARASGAFSFYRDGPEPFSASKSGFFRSHVLLKEYTASPLDLRAR